MVAIDIILHRTRAADARRKAWRLPDPAARFVDGRLPLGTFAQGRTFRRAMTELAATSITLVGLIAAFTILQLHLPPL